MNLTRTRSLRIRLWSFTGALLMATLVSLLVPPVNMAQPNKPVDLRGVWKSTYGTPGETVRQVREFTLEITRQEGHLLWGFDIWHPVDPATGKPLPKPIRDPFVGSLGPGGDRGLLVKEGVQFAFGLKGPDEMELELVSFRNHGGFPPTAFYAVLKRGEIGSSSCNNWKDLSGSWRGRCQVVQGSKLKPSSVRLDLVRQDDELLWVDDVWSPAGPLTSKTDPKDVLRERMLGSLNPAGTGGVLAKEGVRASFRLLAPDRMEVEYIRMGGSHEEATAFYAMLRREGEEPMPALSPGGVNLVGTWTWSLPDRQEATSSLVITRQEGNALWAEDIWSKPVEKGAAPVPRRDLMAGSLSPDQTRGALAKPGACLTFRVLDADHLEFAFTRIEGEPTAYLGVLTRKR